MIHSIANEIRNLEKVIKTSGCSSLDAISDFGKSSFSKSDKSNESSETLLSFVSFVLEIHLFPRPHEGQQRQESGLILMDCDSHQQKFRIG